MTYRSADLGNVSDILSEIVYIMLSLNTRERVYQRLFSDLRREFPRWLDVLDASDSDLEAVLRPGGLQGQRAGHIKRLLGRVRDDNLARGVGPALGGDLTLEYLREERDDQAESFLLSLPGIGRKSAYCVMAYALERPRFAVDTHVERIFRRLGIVGPKRSPNSKVDHDQFQPAVAEKLRKQLHINLVHHGRAVCQNRKARCDACVLISFCQAGVSATAAAARGGEERPVAIDLFAGAGGLGWGFRQEGFRLALAVESDRHAAQTYRANNPGVPVIEADVTSLNGERVRELCVPALEVDAVLAGPPCQGYSAAGKRIPEDAKNLLFDHVVRIAEELGAQLVIMENVPGLRRVNGVGFLDRILRRMQRRYNADRVELRACDFGVPQNRTRLFFLGHRKDLGPAPAAPPPTHRPFGSAQRGLAETPSLEERLRGALELEAGTDAEWRLLEDGTELLNASTMKHGDSVIAKIREIEPGKGPISYRRLERDVARTLVAGHRALPVHPWLHRTISVREAARVQGFEDSYVFCGPRHEQPLQVANAVPPPVARAVARHLISLLPGQASRRPGAR